MMGGEHECKFKKCASKKMNVKIVKNKGHKNNIKFLTEASFSLGENLIQNNNDEILLYSRLKSQPTFFIEFLTTKEIRYSCLSILDHRSLRLEYIVVSNGTVF